MKRFKQYLNSEKTLYVHRPLINGEQVVEWFKKHGCTTCLKPDKMHVTLCYSKEHVMWPVPFEDIIEVSSFDRSVQVFGDNATVLRFEDERLTARANQLKLLGAVSKFPNYAAHITITYNETPKKMPPYMGRLIFGPEKFEEIPPESSWKNSSLEESIW